MKKILVLVVMCLVKINCCAGFLLMSLKYAQLRQQEQYMDSIYNIGNDMFNKHSYYESVPYICEYAAFKKDGIQSYLIHSHSEESRSCYWARYRDIYVKQIPFLAYYFNADTLISKALDSSLFSKGILLNTSMTLKQAIADYKPSLLETYDRFEKFNFECQQIEKNTKEINREDIYVFQQRDSLDTVLKNEMPLFFSVEEELSVIWEDIRSVLIGKDVAVDFAEIPMLDNDILYVAFVVKASYESPKMIPIFKKSELSISNQYPVVDESMAYSKIWAPLDSLLRGSENVYFSPTGILNRIAMEYLPDERGLPISWLYNMFRLSNLRELVIDYDTASSVNRVGLIGGLDYDVSTSTKTKGEDKKKQRGAAREYWSYLPASFTEVQDIKTILEEQNIQTDLYTGCDMPEDSISLLKKKQYDILHFATHGFYFDKQIEGSEYKQEFDALSCSGISLSGANGYFSSWFSDQSYTSTPNDNVLTSLEISRMNLSNVNMVVLSTCVSGLGFAGQDGIYGLQRALKKSGVKSQLVSLWNIEDEPTSIFVTSFYRYYIQTNDKFKSLKLAQQALCVAHNGCYNHPKYWASFVLIDGIDHDRQGNADVRKKKILPESLNIYILERMRKLDLKNVHPTYGVID